MTSCKRLTLIESIPVDFLEDIFIILLSIISLLTTGREKVLSHKTSTISELSFESLDINSFTLSDATVVKNSLRFSELKLLLFIDFVVFLLLFFVGMMSDKTHQMF